MEGLRERDGSGTGTPFRDKPPPPPVVSKGCVESGEFNNGGGGGACFERVC